MRHRRHELRLHLLDEPVGGDVAEREDAPGYDAERIAHHRFGQRQPDLLAPAADRHEAIALAGAAVGLERPLQHLRGRAPERLGRGHASDLFRGGVPEDDVALAVDSDNAVGDVPEDRRVLLLLERDTLVQLGVRERRRGVRGERAQRLDLLLAPGARTAAVDREHAVQRALGADERDAEE